MFEDGLRSLESWQALQEVLVHTNIGDSLDLGHNCHNKSQNSVLWLKQERGLHWTFDISKNGRSPPSGDLGTQALSVLCQPIYHVASKVTLLFSTRCLKRNICVLLLLFIVCLFWWAQSAVHIFALTFHWLALSRMVAPNWREARSVSYLVPRKKGTQACELWEGLCQVRSSSFIYQRTTEPLLVPGPGLICGSVTLEAPHSLGEVTYCRQRGWKRPLWSMSMSHTGE